MNLTPDQLTLETFLPCLHTRFRVGPDAAHCVEMELVEASAMNYSNPASPAKTPVQVSFSLIFHGPGDRLLPQQIYPFEHDQLGRFELFLVPIGQQPGIFQYQAVFNRLIKP